MRKNVNSTKFPSTDMLKKTNTQNGRDIHGVVDIGTQQVRVLIGQPDGQGRLSVLGVGTAPAEGIDERGVANIEKAVESIRKALHQASQQSGTLIGRVWVGLSYPKLYGEWTPGIVTFSEEDHEVTYQDLERLRQQATQRPTPADMELIHAIPQVYHIDQRRNIRDPLGMSGVRLEGNFFLLYAPQEALHMLRRCFQRLGLEVEAFVSRGLVAAEALLPHEVKSSGAALLYIGAHSTTVVAYADGLLRHFAVLPLGGKLVTEDLREALRILLPTQVENLKIQAGAALASQVPLDEILRLRVPGMSEPVDVRRKFLAEVIQARYEEIFLFAANEIKKAGLLRKLYGGFYLAGGGAAMKGVVELAEYTFGERVTLVDIRSLLGKGITESIASPQMAGAVSLLYMAPYLQEFLPPLPPTGGLVSTSKAEEEKVKAGPTFVGRVRSFLEKSFKLPQDLIE